MLLSHTMFLEAITIGALVYVISCYKDKATRPPIQTDLILLPLDVYRLTPHEADQPDIIKRKSRETLKDKQEVLPDSRDPQDIALDLIRRIDEELANAPDPFYGKEGYYVSETNDYIPLNIDV